MNEPRFPVLGQGAVPLLGRVAVIDQIWRDLTKTTPSNLSVVGPRFIGKSVIMNALAEKASQNDSPYDIVLSWHLGRIAPESDEEFIKQLCSELSNVLANLGDSYAEHREYLRECTFDILKEVTDEIDADGKSILMLWDGFDKPLGQGKLTVHLWDQMRSIFYGTKHKIVTATRAPLNELIRNEDAITSPFWNIFDMSPVRVGVFDDSDCESILNELSDLEFEQGAKTELINWSSGFPPLFLELLNQIIATNSTGSINNVMVNQAAMQACDRLDGPFISSMWDDCSATAKDLYLHLVERGEQDVSVVGREERNHLLERGFAGQKNNKISAQCRMLQEYAKNAIPDAGSMGRLFGTWDDYKANIRSLLERRLKQIEPFDERLFRLVSRAIEDIPDYADDCLTGLDGIEQRVFDLIWQREFGEPKIIPDAFICEWESISPNDQAIARLRGGSESIVPHEHGPQCALLQILTGSRQRFQTKAQYISKDTYVLVNTIHGFRNRQVHSEGQPVPVGVAVAAMMSCLELLSCLERELT